MLVQEKVDGSQFSFGKIDGKVFARSKKVNLDLDAPEGMFREAVEQVNLVADLLEDGWTYRGEYLKSPKHNTLNYQRIPINHIILFDIDTGMENYVGYQTMTMEAQRLGFETVPVLYYGMVTSVDMIHEFMSRESVLGGPIEGVVIKNYHKYNAEKKLLLGKHVSEAFKETNDKNWKAQKMGQRDIVEVIVEKLATERRWQKAVEHLRDEGRLEHSPRDIGLLIKEIPDDVLKDCEEDIKRWLFEWAWPKLQRGLTKDFPIWYKEQLLESQFNDSQME